MMYRTLLNNVLVKPLEKKDDDSAIIIQDGYDTTPLRGVIKKVGPGEYKHGTFILPTVDEGEIVHFYPENARTVIIDAEEYYILNQEDILLVEI